MIISQANQSHTSFLQKCTGPLCTYFLLLNLTSGLTYLKYSPTLTTAAIIIALCGFIALSSSIICQALRKWRPLFTICVSAFLFFFNLMAILDYFMLINFNEIFNQDAMDVIADTNETEISGFLRSYLSIGKVTFYLIVIILYNIVLFKLAKLLSNKSKLLTSCFLSLIFFAGFIVLCYCGFHYIKYGNGIGIPQCTTATRVLYSIKISRDNMRIQNDVLNECREAQATISTMDSIPDIVVIIGESHSVFHSQLYGYEKSTEPQMTKIAASDNFTLFHDAMTPWDITVRAMQAIFSTSDATAGLQKAPLFPALFKNAGYRTAMYDNQYMVGKGISLLGDAQLSDAMFDERNPHFYQYDSQLIETIDIRDQPSLYVVHLYGQHYHYADRFPSEFRIYSKDDYTDSIPEKSRDVIANYDNATRFTDHNLSSIIEKFQHRDCAIIYLSDHGEEVYDYSDKMGHGYAADAPIIDYQLRIPLWIWLSPSYTRRRPELAIEVKQAAQYPVSSNDIAHTILRLGLIDTPYFEPSRCAIDSSYDFNRHRIALSSIDFDIRSQRAPFHHRVK